MQECRDFVASTAGAYVFHAFLKGKQQNRHEDLYVLAGNNMTKVIVSSNFIKILYSCLLLEIYSVAELFLRKKICRMKKYIFVKTCPRLPNENAFTLDIWNMFCWKKKPRLMQNENRNCCYDKKRQSIMNDSINCLEMKSKYECLAHEGNSQFLSK